MIEVEIPTIKRTKMYFSSEEREKKRKKNIGLLKTNQTTIADTHHSTERICRRF
jgi:hypothetical protein